MNSAGDHALEAVAAARSVGVEELATLVEQAMASLVGGYKPDRDERQATLVDSGAPFEEFDSAYYALEESLDLDAAMNSLAASA